MVNPDSAVDVIRNPYCLECHDRTSSEAEGNCCICGHPADKHHVVICSQKKILERRNAWAKTHLVNSPLYNWPPCMK